MAAPAAVGANVTLTVQDPPAAIELPQVLLVSANGAADADRDAGGRGCRPGWSPSRSGPRWSSRSSTLPNDRLVGDAVSAVAPVTPVPVSPTVSGLLGALLATASVPVEAPVAVGL